MLDDLYNSEEGSADTRDVILMSFFFHPDFGKRVPEHLVLYIKSKMETYVDILTPLSESLDVNAFVKQNTLDLLGYFQSVLSICNERLAPTGKLERLELDLQGHLRRSLLIRDLYLTALSVVS